MKINEIIEPRDINRPVSTPFNIQKMGLRQPGDGGGAYALGTEDPGDPHMYRKKIRMPSNLVDDAYFQYIRACSPYMKSNPYFPRVYEVVFKKYANGYVKPSYHMEKLLSLKDAREQLGEFQLANTIAEQIYHEDALQRRRDAGLEAADIIRDISDSMFQNNTIEAHKLFKDKKLIEAIWLILKVLNSNEHFSEDLHNGNFMVRIGSTGPQLVFTDPLQDNGKSIAAGYNPFNGLTMANNPDANLEIEQNQRKLNFASASDQISSF